jgi:alkanesulfonate monooxygenase SsuD/methylene tetrahydromethanopterin reductase-like flavin-dependent oxidoreductase (luciferase family)
VWCAEHHFFDYSFCPDNVQVLSYLAGRCNGVEVGTAAVILPWHDPLRVAEQISVLDIMVDGRLRLGLGRGLSRREFVGFRSDLGLSRELFDESATMIIDALRTGYMKGDGPHFLQPLVEIRPRPERPFDDRLYVVASSSESVEVAARLKARLTMFADRTWEHRLPGIELYRQKYAEYHGTPPPRPMTGDFTVCLSDPDRADEIAQRHLGGYLPSVLEHYELAGEHFEATKGYASYATASAQLRAMGMERYLSSWLGASAYGTPDQVLATLDARRRLLGDYELQTAFRFGGIPYPVAEESLRLFAAEVLPVLKTWP